jgi:hypothetical protein
MILIEFIILPIARRLPELLLVRVIQPSSHSTTLHTRTTIITYFSNATSAGHTTSEYAVLYGVMTVETKKWPETRNGHIDPVVPGHSELHRLPLREPAAKNNRATRAPSGKTTTGNECSAIPDPPKVSSEP